MNSFIWTNRFSLGPSLSNCRDLEWWAVVASAAEAFGGTSCFFSRPPFRRLVVQIILWSSEIELKHKFIQMEGIIEVSNFEALRTSNMRLFQCCLWGVPHWSSSRGSNSASILDIGLGLMTNHGKSRNECSNGWMSGMSSAVLGN